MDREDEQPIEIPITDVFDLHSIPPRDIPDAVEAYLEEAKRLGFEHVRIIHGKGIGVQRERVRSILARTPFVKSFTDAPIEAGGWGATLVVLGDAMQPSVAKFEEIAKLAREYREVLADAESLLSPLTPEQFVWQESAGRWSIAHNIAHLMIVDGLCAERVEAAIAEGRRARRFADPPFRYGFIHRWFLKMSESPPRLRFKAPKALLPHAERDPARALEGFRATNERLRRLLEEANGLDLAGIKVPSVASTWLKWPLGILLAVCAAHDRRHLYQAREVMRNPQFPGR